MTAPANDRLPTNIARRNRRTSPGWGAATSDWTTADILASAFRSIWHFRFDYQIRTRRVDQTNFFSNV
jgi:hypothetical protein